MKTYKQLITEAEKNFLQRGFDAIGGIEGAKKLGIGMAASAIVAPIAKFFSGDTPDMAAQSREASKEAAAQQRRDKEFKNAAKLDAKDQTAQSQISQKPPLGTEYKQPNVINAPKTKFSNQRTELV